MYSTALLFLILVLNNTPQRFSKATGAPNSHLRLSVALEHVRARLRRLWLDYASRSNITKGLALRNATDIKFSSVVFDTYVHYGKQQAVQQPHNGNYRRQEPCIDKDSIEGSTANTCEKQRNAGLCAARLSGMINDGLCARTCGLCGVADASAVGMRLTFAFHSKKASNGHPGYHLSTLSMQPTGHWKIYNPSKGSVGVRCNAQHYPSLTNDDQLQV